MARLLDTLERVQADPDKDGHLALQIEELFRTLADQEELSEDIELHLSEMEGDYILSNITSNLSRWYFDDEFEAALLALDDLETGIGDAKAENWHSVAAVYHHRRIELRASLAGHDVESEIEEALDFLETCHESISSALISPIVESAIDKIEDLSSGVRKRWKSLLESLAAQSRSEKQFTQEREYLKSLRQLRLACSRPTSSVEQHLIDSYRKEADWTEGHSALQKADVLESGIAVCAEYMDDTQRREWKEEALQARRRGIETEMAAITVEDLPGIDPDDIAEEIQHNTDVIVNFVVKIKESSGSAAYALYCLLNSPSVIPDANQIRLNSEQAAILQIIQREVVSPEAHKLSIDPADIETIPNNYAQSAGPTMSALGNALYQLIKEGHVTLIDILQLILRSDSLSSTTEAFLIDALEELFDDNHPAVVFLLIPQLEATIVDTLESVGRPPYSVLPEKTRQQLLGGLFISAADLFGDHYAIYLRYRYTSREGLNLRNRLSHGQLRYQNASYLNAVLALFDILRCLVTINSATFLRHYGIPNQTLSSGTHYGDETDLTLFTDLNKQIIGYGRSSDDHKIVVLREHRHEERTELFVTDSHIQRYLIDDISLSRDDLLDEIDDLRGNYPSIPDDIHWTWLDTNDLLLHAVKDLIEDELTVPTDTIAQEQLFTKAQKRGIDESTARTCLSMLEKRDEVVITDRQGRDEVLRCEQPLEVIDETTAVEGIGAGQAWKIVDHFESYDDFAAADVDALQEVDGIGLSLATKIAER